jgi:hypothetical protein
MPAGTRVDTWLIANNESSDTTGTVFTYANSGETLAFSFVVF